MTRISNSDHVLLLLQDQIARLAKDRAGRAGRVPPARGGVPEPLVRLRALARRAGVSEDELKRALVRGLLVQQLGEALGGDPAFEAVAGDVLRIIGESAGGQELIDRALAQLGAS